MRPVIKVENLSKRYTLGKIGSSTLASDINNWMARMKGHEDPTNQVGSVQKEHLALKDINFEINQGDAVGVIGKNGAGKSTLLKILSKITSPTEGSIKVKGRIASLLEVGTGFHPELSGRENIFLNGAILGMTKKEIRSKFDEIVDFSGVEKFIETPVKRYSSGMYVRLAFAVAAHLESEIMIVDEVLAVGDADFQKKCLGKMQDVTGSGRTILFVSHNMAAVQNLCNQSILLKDGSTWASGTTDDVIKKYLEASFSVKEKIGDRKDRRGTGEVIVTDIRFIDYSKRKELELIIAGQEILIEISYKSKKLNPIKNFNIGLTFYNKDDQFVTVLNSHMASGGFDQLPPEGKVYCHVPKFPLMGGDFAISHALQVENTLVDRVRNAMTISVEEGDFYNTGNTNTLRRQGVYIEQNWTKEF